ncbi:transmembrane protein 116-like [Glandiceps talaboti]
MMLLSCPELDDQDNEDMRILRFVHLVVASLSILGAGSIIVYSVYKRTCRSIEVRPLFHLSIADLFLSICWVIGAAMWTLVWENMDKSDECIYLQAVTEAFHIATFFLTVNYALNVYVRIKDRLNRANNLRPLLETTGMIWSLRIVLIIAWLLPVVLMIPVILLYKDANQDCTRCLLLFYRPASSVTHDDKYNEWLWSNYGSIVFVASLSLSIVALLILYGLAYRVYRQLLSQNVWTERQRLAVSNMRHRITLYILVFLFCWLPALTIAITHLVHDDAGLLIHEYFPLYLVQGITAPSQGFLNSLVYGWTRPSFRSATADPRSDASGGTTPLMKTTYRSYGVASGRKTFTGSRSGSSSPLTASKSSPSFASTSKGTPSPYTTATPSPYTTASKDTPSPYNVSSKGTPSPYTATHQGTPSPSSTYKSSRR